MFLYVVTRASAILAAGTAVVSLIVVPMLAEAAPIPQQNIIDPGYVHPFVVYGGIAAAALATIAVVCGLIEYAAAKQKSQAG